MRHLTVDAGAYSYLPSLLIYARAGELLTNALELVVATIPSLPSLKLVCKTEIPPHTWKLALFECLHELDITFRVPADSAVLATIGHFRDLHTLSLSVRDDCPHPPEVLQFLTTLRIGGSVAHIQSFLDAMAPPRLRALDMTFLDRASSKHLPERIPSLLSHLPSTVSQLSLQLSDRERKTFPAPISVLDLVHPALALPALTSFTFAFNPLPSLSDADLLQMATAWGHTLTSLSFPPDFHTHRRHDGLRPSYPQRPTTRVLPAIAADCPHLRTLVLPQTYLDCDPAPTLPLPLRDSDDGAHQLRSFALHSASKDKAECRRAAALLDALFPYIELPAPEPYPSSSPERTHYRRGWDAIVRFMHAMRRRRLHGVAHFGECDPGRTRSGEGEGEGWALGEGHNDAGTDTDINSRDGGGGELDWDFEEMEWGSDSMYVYEDEPEHEGDGVEDG